ncbi:oxidoreductase NAD-binding domain-containing protein 1 [Patella vulgata]|uniref:oxidoreductase NAD-binding domain-containing protein 1 n=1 Tax=Patella vulgata TaxID=6465 RepID=UPI0024A8A1D9|nr:oxidoreductase NAD-binding domain-containing protein 1 [Patella vulgata]
MHLWRHLNRIRIGCNKSPFRKLWTCSVKMSENNKVGTTHLERTAHNSRNEELSTATVTSVRNESPTVKGLTLTIHNKSFKHKAGQWVDTIIPGIERVGGYSICSPPCKLVQEGKLDLAVKCSDHPPSAWVYHKCKVGDEVSVRVGGDFYYDPIDDILLDDIILIAGGVGINPLYSIIQHIKHIRRTSTVLTTLLYSAKTESELIFKKELEDICSSCQYTDVLLNTTQTQSDKQSVKFGRISEDTIHRVVGKSKPDKITAFICGPLSMIEDVTCILQNCGLDSSKIRFEKWW